jgi:hypothetical protein
VRIGCANIVGDVDVDIDENDNCDRIDGRTGPSAGNPAPRSSVSDGSGVGGSSNLTLDPELDACRGGWNGVSGGAIESGDGAPCGVGASRSCVSSPSRLWVSSPESEPHSSSEPVCTHPCAPLFPAVSGSCLPLSSVLWSLRMPPSLADHEGLRTGGVLNLREGEEMMA